MINIENKRIPIALIIILSFAYFISQFYRSSLGVISNDLMKELLISPESMGRLGGIFFFTFALAQVPIGIILDRFEARIVLALMLIII